MANDPFQKPTASVGSGARPRFHQLAKGCPEVTRKYLAADSDHKTKGRLLVLRPVPGSLTKVQNMNKTGMVDQMSVDVFVVDGEPITEVIDFRTQESVSELEEPLVPGSANCMLPAQFINSATLVNQLRDVYASGSALCGRLGRLPSQNQNSPAYVLLDYTEEEAQAAVAAMKAAEKAQNPFSKTAGK